jgi:hypothetical protein
MIVAFAMPPPSHIVCSPNRPWAANVAACWLGQRAAGLARNFSPTMLD